MNAKAVTKRVLRSFFTSVFSTVSLGIDACTHWTDNQKQNCPKKAILIIEGNFDAILQSKAYERIKRSFSAGTALARARPWRLGEE
jgi:predicted esterase